MNFAESHQYRQTKIVCTLGPSSNTKTQILELAKAGMNVARINVSHGKREDHQELLRIIAEINTETDFQIATLIDTRGAEIRTGDVQDPILVTAGDTVLFAPTSQEGKIQSEHAVIYVGYDGFSKDVEESERILIDNGEISFSIQSIASDGIVRSTADQSGSIGSRRHINLPGAHIDLPSVTEQDWADITFAAENGVDFVALSFIRTPEEVQEVRSLINDKHSTLQIITKVETQQAVQNIVDIIAVSDGIMVARGDLGAEVPFEHLPVIQNEIITRCKDAGKPVIVATHMLESMTEHPIPTRAEVTDVAHAAMQQADATMLSGETASGKHPPVAVDAMDKILRATETQLSKFPIQPIAVHNEDEAYAESAVSMSQGSKAQAIFVFTKSGETVRRVSMCRPHIPIIAFTPHESVRNSMLLRFGVTPLQLPFGEPEETVQAALTLAQQKGLVEAGESVVLVSDIRSKDSVVSSVQLRTLN